MKLKEETSPRVNFNDQLTLAGANCQNVVESMMKRDPYYQRLADQQKKQSKNLRKQVTAQP